MRTITHRAGGLGATVSIVGENLKLRQEIASNSNTIDDCEMVHAHNGSEEDITTVTERGIESLREFLTDSRGRMAVSVGLCDDYCFKRSMMWH